jgi:glycosyltransferase involved in cell wall biosynthesis
MGMRLLHEALELQKARRLDEARRRYEEALALVPDAADGWHMLGVIALDRGEYAAARAHVLRALDLTNWRIGAMRHNLGLILAKFDALEDQTTTAAKRARYSAWRTRASTAPAEAPLVSVVVPSYNHSAYIEHALRSVFAQTHRPLELVVIDDGSTDDSPNVIARCLRDAPVPHQFVRQPNRGAATSINRAMDLAGGRYFNVLNSDDAFAPTRIEHMVAATGATPISWGFSGIAIIDGQGGRVDPLVDRRAFDLLCGVHAVPLQETVGFAFLSHNVATSSGNIFFSRALAAQVGPFREYRYNHDWDFCLRALEHAEPTYVAAPLYLYRLHETNTIVRSAIQAREEAQRVCADYLQWAGTARKPENPFAPAVATWGRHFVNAVLGGGMGELLPADLLKALALHEPAASPDAASPAAPANASEIPSK